MARQIIWRTSEVSLRNNRENIVVHQTMQVCVCLCLCLCLCVALSCGCGSGSFFTHLCLCPHVSSCIYVCVCVCVLRQTRIDLRENVMDLASQQVITRDNVIATVCVRDCAQRVCATRRADCALSPPQVHPILLYKIVDPVRAAYETYDLTHAVEKLVQTTLRSIIGDMGLDDTLASREEIERGLRVRIKNVCLNWGLELMSVELLEITPTQTVQTAMHQQLAAERLRRAGIVEAEGYREKLRTEAEGSAQSTVAIATGDQRVAKILAHGRADARRLVAHAEAQSVTTVAEALQEFGVNPTSYLVGIKYIEAMTNIACQATSRVLYMPFETDVVGAVAELNPDA